ncbi:MAG TPA: AMP-binding protein, partial [Acidimicrobiales bacterium]|nr:AMP-binding protein [Acidimicrobiales bacterium]
MAGPISEMAKVSKLLRQLPTEAQALMTIVGSGMVGPERPDRLYAMYRTLDRYGPLGAAISAAAIRHGDRTAVVDELGSVSYRDMDRRSNALANAFRARGVGKDTGVGVLCRNHRGMFDASFGVLKAGGRVLYLNTDFAAPQAKEVCAREGVEMLVYDEEFADVVSGVDAPRGRFLAWTDDPERGPGDGPTLESLITTGNPAEPPKPAGPGNVVILTSGTTGT